MSVPPTPPRRPTVFDVAPKERWGYQELFDHLTDIGMEIARCFAPDADGKISDAQFDRVEAFLRATEAVNAAIRVSHELGVLRRGGARLTRQRRRESRQDPDDADLLRPINQVFATACIDLATAASILGVPPWTATTPDSMRRLIVALARREAARLEAAGAAPPAPFSAEILDYPVRPAPQTE